MSKYGQTLAINASKLVELPAFPLLESLMGIPGGQLYARIFTVKAHGVYADLLERDDPNSYARMVAELALDANGNRLFDISDVPVFLEHMPHAMLSNIAVAIVACNGRVVSDPLEPRSEAQPSSSPVVSAVPSAS